jgi:hypothetical protein
MKFLTFTLAMALLLGLTGCETTGVVDPEPSFSDLGLTHHRRDVVLRDVPLPGDFVMLPNSFFHGSEGGFRYGEFLFHGQLSVDDLFFYYKKQMLANGWREDSLKQFETNARMAYLKNGEKCTILLREGVNLTEMKIIIEQLKK